MTISQYDRRVSYRKSTFSTENADCVQIASDLCGVRDSKNPTGAELMIDVRPFVSAIKDSR